MSKFSRNTLLVVITALLIVSCTKKQDEESISPKQHSQQTGQVEQLDYEEIMTTIETIQNQIIGNPADVALHKKLVETSVDEDHQIIRAMGQGKQPPDARSTAIAEQAALDAAFIDASQWVAYIIEWKKDPQTPEFGKIQAKLPGTRIVYKTSEGDLTKVLIESKLVQN